MDNLEDATPPRVPVIPVAREADRAEYSTAAYTGGRADWLEASYLHSRSGLQLPPAYHSPHPRSYKKVALVTVRAPLATTQKTRSNTDSYIGGRCYEFL